MLECVVNIAEGQRTQTIDAIGSAATAALIDTHSDAHHNRTVFTLAGDGVVDAAIALADEAVEQLDLRAHAGAHPRLGVLDVVPFVPIEWDGPAARSLETALAARQRFAEHVATKLAIPCFFYGPERSLPDVRREAFLQIQPDLGPRHVNLRSGACCVGARLPLIAYNLWLHSNDFEHAKAIARAVRSDVLRCLAFDLAGSVQISCNLIDPWTVGPAQAFDLVAAHTTIDRAELVGLMPRSVLRNIARSRWSELDTGEERTIESRLEARR